jgi:SAM-dependent methyltransferase
MPTSPYAHLYSLVTYLDAVRPTSILDVGLGNGKLGFIARDYLDVMIGERYKKKQWQLQLDGIEVYGDYIQDHQRAIYNDIFVGDAFDVIDGLNQYDMILMGDVLEHFDKPRGLEFMDKCFAHAQKAIALFIPLGDGWSQGAIYGNPYETHLSAWQIDDFLPACRHHQLIEYEAGQHGSFLMDKERYIDHRIEALRSPSA